MNTLIQRILDLEETRRGRRDLKRVSAYGDPRTPRSAVPLQVRAQKNWMATTRGCHPVKKQKFADDRGSSRFPHPAKLSDHWQREQRGRKVGGRLWNYGSTTPWIIWINRKS